MLIFPRSLRPASGSFWRQSSDDSAALLLRCAAIVALSLCTTGTGHAEERYQEFLTKLQEQGYHELALHFLDQLRRRESLPHPIKLMLDLEESKVLIARSKRSDPETERRLLDRAKELLGRFLGEHGELSAAEDARWQLAMVHLRGGQRLLSRAENQPDPSRVRPLRVEAREAFQEAKKQFELAAEAYRDRLRDSKASQSTPTRRSRPSRLSVERRRHDQARLESSLVMARLNQSIADYFIARTYPTDSEAQKARRLASIDRAEEGFEQLFQVYRGSFASLTALLWQARAVELRGTPEDYRQALMRYDEILANEPERSAGVASEQLGMFTQAEEFRLRVLNLQGRHNEVSAEATLWLKQHPDLRGSPLGTGVRLEQAKALAIPALKMPAGFGGRRRALERAMAVLDEAVGHPSPHQYEAFSLRQKIALELQGERKPTSLSEAMVVADALMADENWDEAARLLQQALAVKKGRPDPEAIDSATYRLSYCYHNAGKGAQAAQIAEKHLHERPHSKVAPDMAAIALAVYTELYNAAETAEEKKPQSARVAQLARYIEQHWPDHSVSDAARRTWAGILLYERKFLNAARIYGRIAPASPLYAEAQAKVAQAYWGVYLSELSKAGQVRDDQSMSTYLHEARAAVARSIAAHKATLDPSVSPPASMIETQLLSAEIALHTGAAKEAMSLLEPLRPLIQSADRKELENLRPRLLIAALQTAISVGDLDRAWLMIGQIEQEMQGGTARVTHLYVKLARSLEQQIEQLDAAGKPEQADAVRRSYQDLLERLATREGQTIESLQYLAESYFALQDYPRAAATYARILSTASQNETFAQRPQGRIELLRARIRRAMALRLLGRYPDASAEVERVLSENERLLPAMMEKGRILQAWGEAESEKLQEAIHYWYRTAQRLQGQSPLPSEYFEARYGMAYCYAKGGRNDRAVRWLRSTMAVSPSLGGPEMKARYEALLRQLQP